MNIRLLSPLLALTAAVVLAIQPLIWLWRTWHENALASQGGLIGIAVAVLFLWSFTSQRRQTNDNTPRESTRFAWILLILSGLTRLASQLLGINLIGAMTLVIDVYALACLAGLNTRERAVSPGWLAILFSLSLPIERILQRLFGYPLQELAASFACAVLKLGADPVVCHGIELQIAGQHVLVDLPCAGTAALHTVMVVLAAVACVRSPGLRMAGAGVVLAIASALLANVIRIVLLAIGIAYPHVFGGIDVMAAPWHEGIGLVTISIPVITVLLWARRVSPVSTTQQHYFTRHGSLALSDSKRTTAPSTAHPGLVPSIHPAFGVALLITAVVIISLPTRPIDVSRSMEPLQLPAWLNGQIGTPMQLTSLEQQYFSQYGGAVARAQYGNQVLLVVKTSSPLRHIHSPEDCLRGIGHTVRYQGQTRGDLPSAIYRSTDPQGNDWRISVSYVSQDGQRVTSIGHVAWLWMQEKNASWTMVQRISPWHESTDNLMQFDNAVVAALDATFSNPT